MKALYTGKPLTHSEFSRGVSWDRRWFVHYQDLIAEVEEVNSSIQNLSDLNHTNNSSAKKRELFNLSRYRLQIALKKKGGGGLFLLTSECQNVRITTI